MQRKPQSRTRHQHRYVSDAVHHRLRVNVRRSCAPVLTPPHRTTSAAILNTQGNKHCVGLIARNIAIIILSIVVIVNLVCGVRPSWWRVEDENHGLDIVLPRRFCLPYCQCHRRSRIKTCHWTARRVTYERQCNVLLVIHDGTPTVSRDKSQSTYPLD